jgi:hypothetical protein
MAFDSRLASRVVVWALVSCMGSAAGAADDIGVPDDPVAKAAFDVLERSCARCHQEGRLLDGTQPAAGFGNILKLDEISANPNLIVPGLPHGSRLFKRIVNKEMPYDVFAEGVDMPSPSAVDIEALETWINALALTRSSACESHTFVSNKDIVALIAADLETLEPSRAKATRYLTLTHFTNICEDPKALEVYAQGAIKLVDSLSRSSDVVRLKTIDPDRSILRINLDDIGWNESDWDLVLANDPFAVLGDMQLTHVLEATTGTKLPYVRADWFAFAAARPPLYNRLLRLPETFQELAENQGVDVEDDIHRSLAKRAGFQLSGVSANNRLIERHSARNGYFWTSYDFGGNRERQSLYEFPLGPGGPRGFDHDGGETIFSLPNGFQAYYLNTAKGQSLDKGPTNIVRDKSRKDFAVTNGISCMGCHDQGMKKNKDEIRAHVLAGRAFPKDVKDAVAALYPPNDVMDGVLDEDQKRFLGAMRRAGLEPTLKRNGIEMINVLANRYEADVDATLAAAELGLTKTEFRNAAEDAAKELRPLLRRLDQSIVPRDHFESAFKALAEDVTDDRPLETAAVPTHDTAARPRHKSGLSLTSDRNSYRQGDTPIFTILSDRACYLTLTDVDEKGAGTVLFPNRFQQDNRIRAHVGFQFPAADAPFRFRTTDKGFETIIAVCTDEATGADGITHDFAKAAFTSVENYTRSAARLIGIEARSKFDAGKVVPRPIAQDARHEISRSAIKVEVR